MKATLYEMKEMQETAALAAYLRDLARQVEAGHLQLPDLSDLKTLALPPELLLEIEIEEKSKDGVTRYSFELEFRWTDGKAAEEGKQEIAEATKAEAEAILG